MESLRFEVYGNPATAGSKRGFVRGGKAVVVDDCKRNKPWQQEVSWTVRSQYNGPLLIGPLMVQLAFYLQRPASHFRTGRFKNELRVGAPEQHTQKPDALKLARSVEDALTGVLWGDDAQIVEEQIYKFWCEQRTDRPGVVISVRRLPEQW